MPDNLVQLPGVPRPKRGAPCPRLISSAGRGANLDAPPYGPTTAAIAVVRYLCAGACSTARANLTGIAPGVPLAAVRMAREKMWVTHEKARRDLSFTPGPDEQALARAVEWFSGPGRLPRVA